MQWQTLRNAIKFFFLKDVNEQCQKLCNRGAENSSVLRIPPSKQKVIILLQEKIKLSTNLGQWL